LVIYQEPLYDARSTKYKILVLFTSSGGKEYEEIPAYETARRTQDTKRFRDIVRARKL